MKRFTALILLVGVLLLALPITASAALSPRPQFYPNNYDISEFSTNDRPTDAKIIELIDTVTTPIRSYVKYYRVNSDPYGTTAPNNQLRTTLIVLASDQPFELYIEANASRRLFARNLGTVAGTGWGSYPSGHGAGNVAFTLSYPAGSGAALGSSDQYYNTLSFEEITPGFVVPWDSMKVQSVSATSGTLTWSHKGSGDYTVRITNPTGGDLSSEGVRTVTRSAGSEQMYTITGLKPDQQYGVYVSVAGGLETSRNFTTDSIDYVLKAFMAGQQLSANASTKVSAYSDLEIQSRDWEKFDLYVNDSFVKAVVSPQASTQILLSEFQSKISENLGANIQVKVYKNGSVANIYSFHASSFDYAVGENPLGTKPTIPQKPDNNWDLVGWFEYGVGWIIYLVESVVWLLASIGGLIQTVWSGSSGFIAMLGGIFSFMPKEVTALMVLGMGLAVILRVFGR